MRKRTVKRRRKVKPDEAYSVNDVAAMLGYTDGAVRVWIREHWMDATFRKSPNGQKSLIRISGAEVARMQAILKAGLPPRCCKMSINLSLPAAELRAAFG